MKNYITSFVFALIISINAFGVNRSSVAGTHSWTVAASWSPAGVPNSADNVTIIAGSNITLGAVAQCNQLTINSGGVFSGLSNSAVLSIYGNYTNNGTESGIAQFAFFGVGSPSIGGTGAFSANITWAFNKSRTILSNVNYTRNVNTKIYNGSTVTNNGKLTLTLTTELSGGNWTQGVNSSLTLMQANFFAGTTLGFGSFNCSAVGNTVTLKYTTGDVPNTTAAGYYNLTIAGTTAGIKKLRQTTIVAGDLLVNATNTLNSNGFNLSVAGNWTDSGTFTPGAMTVTFNGGNQTIVKTAATESFNNVVFGGTLTKTLAGPISAASNLTINAASALSAASFAITLVGNWSDAGTFIPGTGTVTFNGAAESITDAAGETFNNIVFANSNIKTLNNAITCNGNLTINASVTLSVGAGNNAITVKGNWVDNGTFSQGTGTVSFTGTPTAQTINSAAAETFENLTINNTGGVSIVSGNHTLKGALMINNGAFSCGATTFTMASSAGQTARIAPITGTGSISSPFVIERFITARDTSWADFSSPVQNSTFLDWENELLAVSYSYTPPTAYPTQYTYSEAADDYVPVTSSGTALIPGLGFEIFLSGDFSYSDWPAGKINTIGIPNQTDQDLSSLVSFSGAGSNFVGNPFASSISWSSVLAASSGLNDYFEMYDYTTGGYNGFTSGSGVEIGSTQGFWVYPTGGGATLVVPENSKTASSNSDIKAAVKELPYFKLKISRGDNKNSFSRTLNIVATSTASDGWDSQDIPFRSSPNKATPELASIADGKKQTINSFNLSDDSYSMELFTKVSESGLYRIDASGFKYVKDYTCVQLEDKQLNKMIDLSAGAYVFLATPDDAKDRFVVHFGKEGHCKSMSGTTFGSDFEQNIQVLPAAQGNVVNFNLPEATDVIITVTNLLGQNITGTQSVNVQNQSVNISIPEDFSGMYLIKVASSHGVVTKKFVRK